MIIFKNKGFQTNSLYLNSDWTGEAKFVVPDGSELANKIISSYPYYDFVLDADGNLIDVVEVEHDEPEPIEPTPTLEEHVALNESRIEYLSIMMEVDFDE